MLAGLVTGLLHTRCGIPAILAGILTQLALYSVNLRIMGWGTATGTQATLPIRVDNYALLVSSRHIRAAGLNNPLFLLALLVAAVIAVLYWFFGTELGCALRATGSNSSMSRAQGINTDTTKVLGLMLSNGLVALSGALLAQYQGSATIDMGRGAIVIGLAAVIIGQVLLSRIFHNFSLKLLSAVIGAIIYYMVIQVVLRLGLDPNDLKLLTALVVAVFLSSPFGRASTLPRPSAKEGPPMPEIKEIWKTFNPGTVNEKQALRGDAIAHGNRLIMMYDGKIVIDVQGEDKKKLTVPQLLELFSKVSGSDEADDKLLLS